MAGAGIRSRGERTAVQQAVDDVRISVRRRLMFANLAGAATVISFMRLASGNAVAPNLPSTLQLLGPLIPLVILIGPAYLWGQQAFNHTMAWALEDRPPTLAERFAVLEEPWRQALRPLLFWVVGAFGIYPLLSALAGADIITVVRVAEGTLIGGLTTCALAYLMIERSFRPLFALVLDGLPEHRPRTPGIRLRLLLTWAIGSGVPLLAIGLVMLFDAGEIQSLALVLLALVGLAAGFLATVASARSVAEPLDGLRSALGRVGAGDLDDGGEVGEVQSGFNRMVAGLRERRQLRDLFGRHVGHQVATQALARGSGLRGEQADASVVFVDLVGSTAMAEVLPPDEVVQTLN